MVLAAISMEGVIEETRVELGHSEMRAGYGVIIWKHSHAGW